MKVLMISTDRSVFDKDSAFRARLFEYQKRLGHITVLVLGVRGDETLSSDIHVIGVAYKTRLGTFLAARRAARDIVAANPTEWLVTTQDEFTGLIGYSLKKRFGVPWRAEVHTDILSPWFGRVFFKNNLRKLIFRLTIKKASCVRVVSERIKKSFERQGIMRAPIVVLPVKPKRPTYEAASGSERYFLILSRLTYEKNTSFAIRAFKKIAEAHPDILLKIVGEGSQRPLLERLATDLGIRNRVVFLGWQSQSAPLMAGALSLVSTSWYEGFGLSVLEAMGAGCPVITTDVGIAGDTLKHEESGIIIEHNDVEALAGAMTRLIKDPEYRAHLAQIAKHAAEPFFDEDAYWRVFDESFSLCNKKK